MISIIPAIRMNVIFVIIGRIVVLVGIIVIGIVFTIDVFLNGFVVTVLTDCNFCLERVQLQGMYLGGRMTTPPVDSSDAAAGGSHKSVHLFVS